MVAGGSAGERGRRARETALELSRRAREAYAEAGRWEAASEAERQVAATLVGLTAIGWRLLVDRRWPGTRAANVDMILVGPAGVFVIDVKRWRDAPSVRDGALFAGREPRGGEVARLLAMTRTAEEQVSALGMSPVALRPLLVFAGHRLDATLGRVRLLGHPDAVHALLREPRRLTRPMVRAVADHLAEAFPAYEAPALEERAAPEPDGAAHLAARGHGRVLYVTFAKNLPRVQRQPTPPTTTGGSSRPSGSCRTRRTRPSCARRRRRSSTTPGCWAAPGSRSSGWSTTTGGRWTPSRSARTGGRRGWSSRRCSCPCTTPGSRGTGTRTAAGTRRGNGPSWRGGSCSSR